MKKIIFPTLMVAVLCSWTTPYRGWVTSGFNPPNMQDWLNGDPQIAPGGDVGTDGAWGWPGQNGGNGNDGGDGGDAAPIEPDTFAVAGEDNDDVFLRGGSGGPGGDGGNGGQASGAGKGGDGGDGADGQDCEATVENGLAIAVGGDAGWGGDGGSRGVKVDPEGMDGEDGNGGDGGDGGSAWAVATGTGSSRAGYGFAGNKGDGKVDGLPGDNGSVSTSPR